MKKAALGFVLGVILTAPVTARASYPESSAAIAIAMMFGFVVHNGSNSEVPKNLAPGQAEIYALNHQEGNQELLSQSAGGSLNTADILK